MNKRAKAYAESGVDMARAGQLLRALKPRLGKATRPEVIGALGGFGGLFDFSKTKYKHPVLVSSTDSVGTKVKVASAAGCHTGVGHDIVNHCCNDIAVMGAEPLFFLDYFASAKLDGKIYKAVLNGIAAACEKARCALIGGETAELPGVYHDGEYDLVGTIVGVAEKTRLLSGAPIRPGDRIIGLASNGLHTNGYTLARKIFFDQLKLKPGDNLPGARQTVASALLKPHTNYANALRRLCSEFNRGARSNYRRGNAIFGVAHLTGGGFTGNLPRSLPEGCAAEIDTGSWPKPPVFKVIQEQGGVSSDELYEVFNMGIGLALFVASEASVSIIKRSLNLGHRAFIIGEVIQGRGVKLK